MDLEDDKNFWNMGWIVGWCLQSVKSCKPQNVASLFSIWFGQCWVPWLFFFFKLYSFLGWADDRSVERLHSAASLLRICTTTTTCTRVTTRLHCGHTVTSGPVTRTRQKTNENVQLSGSTSSRWIPWLDKYCADYSYCKYEQSTGRARLIRTRLIRSST